MSICILDTAAVITMRFFMLARTPSDEYCAVFAVSQVSCAAPYLLSTPTIKSVPGGSSAQRDVPEQAVSAGCVCHVYGLWHGDPLLSSKIPYL